MPHGEPLRSDDPRRVNGYAIDGLLGEGGQGIVYLGRADGGAQVAVKLLHARLARSGAARERFLREIDMARRVAQFCTARILDVGVDGDRPYVVSELVEGPSLHGRVEAGGPLGGGELERLAVGTATALAAIHEADVLHRDFKPHNVLLGPDGPRVIDFGIARALDVTSTLTSGPVGTPAYMAPEQISGGSLTAAVDIFAWAATIVFAATGRPAFGQDTIPAVMHRILHAEPDLAGVPEKLRPLLASCLEKDPALRPSAATILLRLLGRTDPPPLAEGRAAAQTPSATATVADAAAAASPQTGSAVRPVRPKPRTFIAFGSVVGTVALVAALVFVVRGLSGGSGDRSGGSARQSGQTVAIGFMGALTGTNALIAVSPLNGVQLAIDRYNATNPAVRIRLNRYDTAGDANQAAGQAQKAVADHDVAIIGPLFSGESKAAVPVLEAAGIPSVTPSASNVDLAHQGWKYWHRTIANDAAVAPALATVLERTGAKKVYVVDDGTSYGQAFADQSVAGLRTAGTATSRDHVDANASDFSTTVNKVRDYGPDAVVYGGYAYSAAKFLKQLRDAGVTARFAGGDGLLDQTLISGPGTASASQIEGVLVACGCRSTSGSIGDHALTAFDNDYKDTFGHYDGSYAVEGYDAADLLIAAIKAGSRAPTTINRYLATADFPGLAKTLRFAADGELADPKVFILEVTNGSFTYIGDSTAARP